MSIQKQKDWSCNLESEEYKNNITLTIEDAIKAVTETDTSFSVNLVTHESLGHPDRYLIQNLMNVFQDRISIKYVAQCGCGGHVLKVKKVL